MARVIAMTRIEHDHRLYQPGEAIELGDAAAEALVRAGAAEPDPGEDSSVSPAEGAGDTPSIADGTGQAPPEAPAAGDEPAADAAADATEPAAPPARRRR